ncbi:hypothetical protein PFISCL1PPCAC_8035, partial [Pristionchus fissidentatus]
EDEEEEEESAPKKTSPPEIVDLDSSGDEEEEEKDNKEDATAAAADAATTAAAPVKKKPSPKAKDLLLQYKSTSLHFDDMKGLFFDEMVNDSIVDLYLMILKDETVKQETRDKVHIFSCFFFKRLTDSMVSGQNYRSGDKAAAFRYTSVERNYSAIMNWTKRVDLFKMDYVIIPVVDDLHWYIIIVIKPGRCVVPANGETDNVKARRKGFNRGEPATYAVVLDSLYDASDPKRQCSVDIIRDYLEMEYKRKKANAEDGMMFDRTRMGMLRPKGLPQQTNFLDCGFFLLKYIETFMGNPPSDNMLRKGVRWMQWYDGFEITVRYMRELVYKTIQKKTDKEVWKAYQIFEEAKRDEWEPSRKNKERLHYAKRRRCMSAEVASRKERRVRHHSEPASLTAPMASHFH